jgi:hypothetical protein
MRVEMENKNKVQLKSLFMPLKLPIALWVNFCVLLTIFTSIVLSLMAPIQPVIATSMRHIEMKIIRFAGVKK